MKTDLHWPTLSDDMTDVKDVAEFYESFEDNCGLANNCQGMSKREMLIALRSRCKGSRLKTFQNIYRQEIRAGNVEADPASVYDGGCKRGARRFGLSSSESAISFVKEIQKSGCSNYCLCDLACWCCLAG